MNHIKIILILIFITVMTFCKSNYSQDLNETKFRDIKNFTEKSSRILSRKKRFLIFPEGSSVQIVFCLTYPTIFNIGEIFLLGNTAALAWELPQDPYSPYRHHADPLHRKKDTKTNTFQYNKEHERVWFQKPHVRKSGLNAVFAKRSINYSTSKAKAVVSKKVCDYESIAYNNGQKPEVPREQDFMGLMDERHRHFHRITRVQLYEKLERFLNALGSNGRHCVLKSLCQVGQSKKRHRGMFIEEVLRAVFTLPKGQEFEVEYHREYDYAHVYRKSCDDLYPDCNVLTLNPTVPIFSY